MSLMDPKTRNSAARPRKTRNLSMLSMNKASQRGSP